MTSHSLPSIRLHVRTPLELGSVVALEQKQAHYISHVMRRKEGDRILVFNGNDGEWLAEITQVKKKSLSLHVLERTRAPNPCPDCWLICAPLKSGHMEVMIEKASELGVSEIHTIKTRHLALKKINPERLCAIAVEAAEQSERLDAPPVHPMQEIAQFLADHPTDAAHPDFRPIFYGDETGHASPFSDVISEYSSSRVPTRWAVLVGPEGGFAELELTQLRKHPACIGVSLGPRILRADTASTTLLALTQSVFGDWSQKPAFRGA